MARSVRGRGGRGQLRIIGGQWRGRKLTFPATRGLRPTTDRVRETLFNWLAAHVQDARCADLFAGSGALGLEALSRGAAHCDFVDTSSAALRRIGEHLEALGAADRAACHPQAAERFLRNADSRYDIVFVDPPFGEGLAGPVCEQLSQRGLLSEEAWVYVETAAGETGPALPADWRLHREKTTGGVCYRLFAATAVGPG